MICVRVDLSVLVSPRGDTGCAEPHAEGMVEARAGRGTEMRLGVGQHPDLRRCVWGVETVVEAWKDSG